MPDVRSHAHALDLCASISARPRLLARALVLLCLGATVRGASALRVAFIADTGIGNDKPGSVWTDHWGNRREPSYKVDGIECKTYEGKYCGSYSRARDVIALAEDASVDLIVHAGDLDYVSSPMSWFHFLTETVWRRGGRFVAVKGNHDVDGWDGVQDLWSNPERGYQALLSKQIPRGAKYYGSYGEDFAMETGGVLFVMSSVGCERPGESANREKYDFIDRALSASKARWKVCVWHMTMESLQVSYKGDATGFGAYEICRKHGAFIVTGHAHVYSRSYTMARFGTKVYGFTRSDLRVHDWNQNVITLRAGEDGTTGLAVVGIGGYKNEAMLTDSGVWAKVYSTSCLAGSKTCERASDARKFGALVCDFGTSSEAKCELRVVARPGASPDARRAAATNADEARDVFALRRA